MDPAKPLPHGAHRFAEHPGSDRERLDTGYNPTTSCSCGVVVLLSVDAAAIAPEIRAWS